MAKNRYLGSYPVIGIRPTIDGRRGALKVREGLEDQTMNMARSAAKLIDDIRARVNDKRSYAMDRLIEQMCCYEDYGCDDMGTESDAAAVGYVELTRWYRSLLQTAPVEIFYCGRESEKRTLSVLRECLSAMPRAEIDYDIGTDIRRRLPRR